MFCSGFLFYGLLAYYSIDNVTVIKILKNVHRVIFQSTLVYLVIHCI